MPRIIVEADEVKVCSGCNEIVEDGDEVATYECGECGTTFTKDDSADGCSNRCPDCNKFAAKGEEVQSECCQEELAVAYKVENESSSEVLIFLEDDVEVAPEPAPIPQGRVVIDGKVQKDFKDTTDPTTGFGFGRCPKCQGKTVSLHSVEKGGRVCNACGWKEV